MKWWYSAFNAQGSSLNIVVVELGTVKIYVAGAQEKGKTPETHQFTTKIDGFLSFTPPAPLNPNVLFLQVS
jgi:hypothetical protein